MMNTGMAENFGVGAYQEAKLLEDATEAFSAMAIQLRLVSGNAYNAHCITLRNWLIACAIRSLDEVFQAVDENGKVEAT